MTDVRARPDTADAHATFMGAAIAAARRGLLAGEPPVGACLVRDGMLVATANNGVIGELDATAHAEMRLIRMACRQLRTLSLAGCTLYVTVEPCPMCLAACHYAGVNEVIFGATLDDMQTATGNELRVPREALVRGGLDVAVTGGCLREECAALIGEWSRGGRS